MNLILIWSVWLITILTFYLGFKWGKEEKIEGKAIINPIKVHKEKKVQKEVEIQQQKEQEKKETIMDNINNYDGTPFGQKDIPE